jgi:hypothetical protein
MKPPKPIIAQQVIALRWKDRLKILVTGKLVVFLGKSVGDPAGVKVYGASV